MVLGRVEMHRGRGSEIKMSTSPQSYPRSMRVGIVGATGLVGELMLSILAERQFPVESLRLFASARSAGRSLQWKGAAIAVEDASTADYAGLDVVFFSAGARPPASWRRSSRLRVPWSSTIRRPGAWIPTFRSWSPR